MIHTIRFKIAFFFLVLVFGTIALVAYFASRQTTQHFLSYLRQDAGFYTARTADTLAQYYAQQGTWDEVAPLLGNLRRGNQDRLVLADASGKVVADTANEATGQPSTSAGVDGGQPVSVNGTEVGILYSERLSPGAGGGAGPGGRGRGQGAGVQTPAEPAAEASAPAAGVGGSTTIVVAEETSSSDFLDAMRRSVLTVGLIAGGITLVVTLFLARSITHPLRELRAQAHRLASGDLSRRVRVRSGDEVGELGAAFNSMAEKLERNEQARRNMLADIAHELRTPLTVIDGTVDGLVDGVFQPTPERLAVLKSQSSILTKLITDLRDLSLMESGQLQLVLQDVQLRPLVEEVLESFQARAREHGLKSEMSADESLRAQADPGRLVQVLNNLLDNALRHSPDAGTVLVSAFSQDDGFVRVSVSDAGPGIPKEEQERVFERFYRLDPSRSRGEGGTGLGLAITKALVEAQGGRIWVEDTPGGGATFSFTIPIDPRPTSQLPDA